MRWLLVLLFAICLPLQAFAAERVRQDPATITRAQLPPEAVEMLALIQAGGPYRHRRDGVVFGNRERHLPQRPRGYYREYTVETPGAKDRGARRIITGAEGERWYTSDHYNSFARIVER